MYTIHTKAINRGPFNCRPAMSFDLEADKIICNDVMLPAAIDESSRFNPHNVRMWIIGHAHGDVCAIWASHEQDALDSACDANMLECFLVTDESDLIEAGYYTDEYDGRYTGLGNTGEPHNLDDCWLAEVEFDPARDILLITRLARASEGGHDTLDF